MLASKLQLLWRLAMSGPLSCAWTVRVRLQEREDVAVRDNYSCIINVDLGETPDSMMFRLLYSSPGSYASSRSLGL